MNTSTSKSKAQLSSIVGIDGKSSQKASAGSSPVVVTPHKLKFNGTVNQASVSKAKVGSGSTVSGYTQKTSCSSKSKLAPKSNGAVKDVKPVDTSGGLKRNCIGKSQVLVQHCRSFHDGPQPHPIRPGITQKFSTRSCRATTLTLTLSIIFVCHAFFYSSRIYYSVPHIILFVFHWLH